MRSPRRMAVCRPAFGALTLGRTWVLLLLVATVLVVIDLHVLWQQVDVSPHRHHGHDMLKDVYVPSSIMEAIHVNPRANNQTLHAASVTPGGDGQRPVDVPGDGRKFNIQGLMSDIEDKAEVEYIKRIEEEDDRGGGGWVETGVPREELLRKAEKQSNDFLQYVQSVKQKPHSKWIVLDITSGTCADVQSAVPSGWKMIVIGQTASLKGCSAPTCTYLPPDLKLGSELMAKEPVETSTRVLRKNLAYLTAISQGAQYLLDCDCTTSMQASLKMLQFPAGKDHGIMYNDSLIFNPYSHFGAWAAVPFALSGTVRAGPNSLTYYLREFDSNVLVKHGVSDTSPDVSSLDGAKRNSGGKVAGMRFDSSAPAVFLGQRSFSAAVPVVSVYRRVALWALLLPCTAHSLRCLILRQLILQRLFRDIDAFSGFYQVKATSAQKTLAINEAELERSRQVADVENLVSHLDAWRCRSALTFLECLNVLGDFLHQKKRISDEEFTLMKTWVKAVIKLNTAAQPSRVRRPWRGVPKTSEVRITLGSMQSRLELGGLDEERLVKEQLVDPLSQHCLVSVRDSEWFPVNQWKKPVIEDIVLIIVFNWNRFFWNNLPFTETMHRPFFKHVFYCVPNVTELLEGNKDDILRHVSFVEGLSDTWYFMYECITIVSQINIQGVRGYLQIGDDTLTNSWKYLKAPRDSMWIPHGFTTMRGDEETHSWSWYWWKKSRGRPAVLQAMADLEEMSGLSPDQVLKLDSNYKKLQASKNPVRTFLQMYQAGKGGFPLMRPMLPGSEVWTPPTKEEAIAFLKNYYQTNHMSGRVRHRAMDFFYVPQRLVDGWVTFSRHFLRRNVLIELAVPAVHYGLSPHTHTRYVSASSLWKRDRNVSYSFYDDEIFFLHPFKMKAHMEQKESSDFFCQEYMRILFAELKKLVKG